MAAADVPKLDVTVNANDPDDDVFSILREMKPKWKRENLKKKTLGEGAAMVNKMFAYHVSANFDDVAKGSGEAIVVRIYGEDYEEYSNREQEIKVTLLFSEIGVSPKVLCTFKNGMCFSFRKGETYDFQDRNIYGNKKLTMAVGRELALIHREKTAKLAVERGISRDVSVILSLSRMPLEAWNTEGIDDPIVTSSDFPKKEELIEEFDRIEKLLADLDMSVILSHNDLHPGNAIFDPTTEKATIIDYEYAHFNYRGWDLAQYLFHSAFGYGFDETPPKMQPVDYKKDFLRNYLERLSVHDNWGRGVTEKDVDELLYKTDRSMLLVMLIYIPIVLIIAQKPPPSFPAEAIWYRGALNAWKIYKETRNKLLGF